MKWKQRGFCLRLEPLVTAAAVAILALASVTCSREPPRPKGTIAPLDVASPPPEASTTPSGLAYRVLVSGKGGPHPDAGSRVEVNYTGWTPDGTIVEGAPLGGPTATFQLSETMPGWREGLRMMSAGDKWRFWIPPHLAYADQPEKPQGMLVYDIDLVGFAK